MMDKKEIAKSAKSIKDRVRSNCDVLREILEDIEVRQKDSIPYTLTNIRRVLKLLLGISQEADAILEKLAEDKDR